MRQIKFRGLHKSTNEWVYGDLEHLPNGNIHIFGNHYSQPVIESSVGQFTGLTDSNGKEIYEGDILSVYDSYNPLVVRWNNEYCQFELCDETEEEERGFISLNVVQGIAIDTKVIGNIHDNKIKEE